MSGGKIISSILGVVVLLVVLSGFFGSFYTVDQGEKAVLLTNGAVAGVVDPGLHFKIPFFQTAVKISTRQQVLYWNCDPDPKVSCEDGHRIVMQAYSRDQQPADLRVTVNFHIPPAEIQDVYASYGSSDAVAERIIARKAPQAIKTVFGQYDAVSVIQNRAKFNSDAASAVSASADGPIVIDSVQIENIDFSDAYEQAVEARMTAQVEVQKQEQQLAQEKIKAQIVVTTAKGKADSNLAIATANAAATKVNAEADAYATETNGKAAASAISAKGEALAKNPGLTSLVQAERWSGVLPTSMIPGGAVPFINVQ